MITPESLRARIAELEKDWSLREADIAALEDEQVRVERELDAAQEQLELLMDLPEDEIAELEILSACAMDERQVPLPI